MNVKKRQRLSLIHISIVWKLMKDYQRQLKEGKEPEFKIDFYPEIKKRVLELSLIHI